MFKHAIKKLSGGSDTYTWCHSLSASLHRPRRVQRPLAEGGSQRGLLALAWAAARMQAAAGAGVGGSLDEARDLLLPVLCRTG